MNAKYNLIAACILICLIVPLVVADDVGPDGKTIPESSWQKPVSAVSIAMFLDVGPVLNIYVKNSSNGPELLPRISARYPIQVFYIKSDGAKMPLENYTTKNSFKFTMPPLPMTITYQPGQIELKTIRLSSDQLTILKQYPVTCRVMYSPIIYVIEVPYIETTPIKLTTQTQ